MQFAAGAGALPGDQPLTGATGSINQLPSGLKLDIA